ncbi:unnamed protein product [Rhizoctonia solani]|nr:unnamed protein product [Rhizoctonia solani]
MDENDCQEVERLLFARHAYHYIVKLWLISFDSDLFEEISSDLSFSSATIDTSISSIWSIDVDTSFATTVDGGEFKIPPSAPSFGFLKSTEECLEDLARTVTTIQNSYNHRSLHQIQQSNRLRISHIRSYGYIRRNSGRSFSPDAYSGHRPSCPLYWKYDKSGDIAYIAAPAHLSYLRWVGNQWTYSLIGPWYPRPDPKIGDIHFSPSEDAGFDYWVYSMINHEGLWCLIRLSQPHPLTNELVLQHLSPNSPPQWALSWPGFDVNFLYVP